MIRPLARIVTAGAAVAVLGLALPLAAQAAGDMKTPTAQEYVDKAAIGDMFEIQSSQLALQKSQDDDVRDFAQMMVEDHNKSTSMIKNAVTESGANLEIPDSMDRKHEDMLKSLQQTPSGDFDEAYLNIQYDAHQEALQLHRSYANGGDDDALQNAAEMIVPVIEEHIDHLKEIMDDKR